MRKLLIGLLLLSIARVSFGQTILLECGQNSGKNFDGWFVENHHPFDAIEFDAYSVAFEHWLGGNFAVTLTRKIEAIKEYDLIQLLFNFEVIRDCKIENVTYYVSEDGKNWDAINASRNNVAITIENIDHTIAYVKVVVNTQFEEDGRIALNYAKIEGDMREIQPIKLSQIEVKEPTDDFFIFNYENMLNIETNSEKNYDLILTSTSGNIVYRNTYNGSNRVELPSNINRGMYVVTIIQNNAFSASKKVLL